MALHRFLKPIKHLDSLPDPNSKKLNDQGIDPGMIRAANDEIAEIFTSKKSEDSPAGPSASRKRGGKYNIYNAELRAKIGKYANENGVNNAARKFSRELGKQVKESTVRYMKNIYQKKIKSGEIIDEIKELPKSDRGRPLLLGREADDKVQTFIKTIRANGGPVSTRLVLATATGLFRKANPPVLSEFGGSVKLEKTWARSVLQRMNFTKRKGTKATKSLPTDLHTIKEKYQRRISRRVRKYKIPPELIINWDQTSVEVIPTGNWTMNHKGDKQVEIKGIDDKRNYTSLMAITQSGHMLPPQIIYQGKTQQCHARADFPNDWDVWHSITHWSTSGTMERYLDTIIKPYVEKTKKELNLPDAKPLLIFDVFAAHRSEDVKQKIADSGALTVYVPAKCTGELQPLDATVNCRYKQLMRDEFQNWFAGKVTAALDEGKAIEEIAGTIDFKTSTIKPVHAAWMIKVHSILEKEKELIIEGFTKSGISKAVWDAELGPVEDKDDSDAAEGDWAD